jgi:hypothetical protein
MRPVHVVRAGVKFPANLCDDTEARYGRVERLLFLGNDSSEEANLK